MGAIIDITLLISDRDSEKVGFRRDYEFNRLSKWFPMLQEKT
jgi:hypothetical protein